MKKLDYELTSEMFNCKEKADLELLRARGVDFSTASRLSIDEVLSKLFNKTCHGTKDLAIQMMLGALDGQDIPDVADKNVVFEDNSPASAMDPEVRKQKIFERVEAYVQSMPNYYEYSKKIMKDPELKMLGASEIDLKEAALSSDVVICGQGVASKKYYLMKKTQENIDIAMKEGDILFYKEEV